MSTEPGAVQAIRSHQSGALQTRDLSRLPGDVPAFGDEDLIVDKVGAPDGNIGEDWAHVGVARSNRFLGNDRSTEPFEVRREGVRQALSVGAPVVYRRCPADPLQARPNRFRGDSGLDIVVMVSAQVALKPCRPPRIGERRPRS